MRAGFVNTSLLILLIILSASHLLRADTTYIKFGAAWKYFDKGIAAPAGAGAADWRNSSFNDAPWKTGPAELGYGENKERTTVNYGGNPSSKYITTYFRHLVNIPNARMYTSFRLNAYIDDGAIIYVNGKEVARSNIAGKPVYSTPASNSTDNSNTITSFDIPVASFRKGANLIAVEVHQSSAASANLSFDLELVAVTNEPIVTRGPLLQMLNSNAITIKWTSATASTSRLKYGTSENTLNSVLTDNKFVTDHEMRITGLAPDTKYYYAIGSATSVIKGSYRNYFITSPPVNTKRKIRIGVFGDPGTGNTVQKGTRDGYIKYKGGNNNSELAIMLGDNAYNAGLQNEHQLNFFDIYDNNIFDNHVVMPVPGNHEYANDRSTALATNLRYTHLIPYYDVFTLPAAGESGGVASGTEQYYSTDYGNIHFIMLDSYGYSPDPSNPSDYTKYTRIFDDTSNNAQAKWLKQDLAANAGKHKWTIACMHHPPYTNGTHASGFTSDGEQDLVALRKYITPILDRYGVDIVLTGHGHVYERSFLIKDHTGDAASFTGSNMVNSSSARYDGSAGNAASEDINAATSSCPYFTIDSADSHGTVYVVAGSAGQIGGGTNKIFPAFYYKNYSGSAGGEAGVLYLEIQDNRLDAKFVGRSGTVHDQFTIMKGVNKNTAVKTTVNTPAILTASWVGAYNWYTVPAASATVNGNARSLSVTQAATGSFTYYVCDSASALKKCMVDTFTVQVTSAMAAAVGKYNAVLHNNGVVVQWTTLQEINSDYFTVERSANGTDYEIAMVIQGKGDSYTATNYEFTDNNPLPGTSYYRLLATDKDGGKKIAAVQSVINTIPATLNRSSKQTGTVAN